MAVALGTLVGIVFRDDVVKILKGRAHLPMLREINHQGLQEGVVADGVRIADNGHVAPSAGDGDVDPPVLGKEANFT